jgi:hypothetical protein
VGGQLKPGHRINLYAYRGERSTVNLNKNPEVRLIATDIPVVDVRSRQGDASGRLVPTATAAAQRTGGLFGAGPEESSRSDPGSIVTVAVPPELAFLVVDTLGAQGFDAWVTLAGNRAVQITPTPEPTLPPTSTPVPPTNTPAPTPNIQATVQAIIQATRAAERPATDTNTAPPAGPARGSTIPTTGGQKP